VTIQTAFDLRAILYHRGPTAHAGHYVADVLDPATGVWWTFNDGEVETRSSENAKKAMRSNDAYMLVFARKNEMVVDANARSYAPQVGILFLKSPF